MRGPRVRHAHGVMVLAAAVLPWAVASPGGLGGSAEPPAVRERAAAIESFVQLLVVTADRPTTAIAFKRADGASALWSMPGGRSTVHPPLGLVHVPWPAVPIERSEPLALHLAGRGPPVALAI